MQIHLWLGLTLGVIGVFIGLSGSVLVFDRALDARLNPQRYAISGAQIALPLSAYAERAAQALEGRARPTAIRLPDGEDGPVVVFARAGAGPFQRVYLDPPTGRVLDIASVRDPLLWIRSFHDSLTLREYNGREIVGVVGIAMLISSLSGIYLWWPARGIGREAFGFRRGFTLLRNLHYTVGFWGALVLATLSFTGIFIAFPDAGRAVVAAFGTLSPSPRGIQAPEGTGRPITPDEAAASRKSAISGRVDHRAGISGRPARRLSDQPARSRRHEPAFGHHAARRPALPCDIAARGPHDSHGAATASYCGSAFSTKAARLDFRCAS